MLLKKERVIKFMWKDGESLAPKRENFTLASHRDNSAGEQSAFPNNERWEKGEISLCMVQLRYIWGLRTNEGHGGRKKGDKRNPAEETCLSLLVRSHHSLGSLLLFRGGNKGIFNSGLRG